MVRSGGWKSWKEENPWILFDFKDKRLNLTSYTIFGPIEWVIEGTNDEELNDESWIELDYRTVDDYESYGGTFSCNNPSQESFRYIRIRLPTRDGEEKELHVDDIEFFGKLTRANCFVRKTFCKDGSSV